MCHSALDAESHQIIKMLQQSHLVFGSIFFLQPIKIQIKK